MPSDDFWADVPKKTPKKVEKQLVDKPKSEQAKKSAPVAESIVLASAPISAQNPEPLRKFPARKVVLILATIVLMLAATLVGGGIALWQGTTLAVFDEATNEPVVIEIAHGRTTRQIAGDLEAAKVIVSRWPFLLKLALTGGTVRAGNYSLSPTSTVSEIVDQLTKGDVSAYRVTIPEGWRLEQMGSYFDSMGVVSYADFMTATLYDSVRYTLPAGMALKPGDSLEGLLFPDTYEFRIGVTSKEIVQKMLTTFSERTKDLAPSYDQVILASIVEREANTAADRTLIAGVYANRLKINMKLDADPTVQYANDNARLAADSTIKMTWWAPITAADYQRVKSLWNTYLTNGLPPSPIANPGLASLTAAVQPATHSYYYFLHKPDGNSVFSKTKEEHDQAKAGL